MHWTERRRAAVRIGEELQRRDWTLYGYTPDRSEPMTDYWSPAAWDGVAVKDGAIACVDVSEYTTRRVGQDVVEHTSVPGEPCAHCRGTGIWPEGLTYEEARANPAGQHFIQYCTERGSRPGHPDVVSPLHYHGVGVSDVANPNAPYGAPKCLHCGGRGHKMRSESTVVGQWPTFQANPKGKTWHVQRDGRIVGSGVGLRRCASYDREEADAAVARICDRIEALAFPATQGTPQVTAREQVTIAAGIVEGDIPFTAYREGDWTWIAFGRKPSQELRDRLKRAGGRWRRRREAWSFKRVLSVQDLAALGLPTLPDEAAPVPGDEMLAEPPPWTMSRRAYQEGRALTIAGGVPILNVQDGRDHEVAVREAVAAGLPVPAHVLADYPDLAGPGPTEGAPRGEGDTAAPGEPEPAAGNKPARAPGAEPTPDAGDYRLAEGAQPGAADPVQDLQLPDIPAEFAVYGAAIQFLAGLMTAHESLPLYMQEEINHRDTARLPFDRIVGDLLADLADEHLPAYAVLAEPPARDRLLDWLFDWYHPWANGLVDTPEPEPAQDAGDYGLAQLRCPGCGLEYHGLVGSRSAVPEPARCPRCGAIGEEPGPDGNQVDDPHPASPTPPTADDSQAGHAPPYQPAPTWPTVPREPAVASGSAIRHTPPLRIAAQPTLTSSGQLSMFE